MSDGSATGAPRRRPTLKDVSRRANVSTFTASRALNGEGGVAAATREHVRGIADAMGYVPNQLARGLRGAATRAIGVLTANTNNFYYAALVGSLERVVQQRGYHCIVVDAVLDGDYRVERENAFVEDLLDHRVAAVVLTYRIQ